MARLPDPCDSLNPRDLAIFKKLEGPRGRLGEMYRVLMNHPELADKLGDLGFYLRYRSGAPGDAREMAILATARELGTKFVWDKHERPASSAGLPGAVLDQLKNGRFSESSMSRKYFEIWGLARDVVARRSVPDERMTFLQKEYGCESAIELLVTCGFYSMIASVVFAFDIDPAPAATRSGKDSPPSSAEATPK